MDDDRGNYYAMMTDMTKIFTMTRWMMMMMEIIGINR